LCETFFFFWVLKGTNPKRQILLDINYSGPSYGRYILKQNWKNRGRRIKLCKTLAYILFVLLFLILSSRINIGYQLRYHACQIFLPNAKDKLSNLFDPMENKHKYEPCTYGKVEILVCLLSQISQ